MGASAYLASVDDATLQSITEDVDKAAQLLKLVAEGRRKRELGRRQLKINSLSGSQFQLEIDETATVLDVSQEIAGIVGIAPGRMLVLTSGGTVLDESKPFLQQLHGDEITYKDQQVGAGQAAVSLLRSLAGWPRHRLCAADTAAADAISSLTIGNEFGVSLDAAMLPQNLHTLTFGDCFNESLTNVALPSSVRTLTFGNRFNQSLAGVTLPVNLQTLIFGHDFDQSLEGGHVAQIYWLLW
ncbi:unnamed protein product [Symbiodinium necroappetens]|uniref:Ubiquitin-like domain-containing protein n=1 Tax=Symbiodinium necroappetens TaxID=1628268 RepID=A0A812QGE4_9DINO|nr:unnamed protein product [Symbiodinium necroappetens]